MEVRGCIGKFGSTDGEGKNTDPQASDKICEKPKIKNQILKPKRTNDRPSMMQLNHKESI